MLPLRCLLASAAGLLCVSGTCIADARPVLPAPAAAPAEEPPAEDRALALHFVQGADWAPLPYEVVRGDILFRATINGLPATVLLDNGTDRTLIDTGFAHSAGIKLTAVAGTAVTGASTRIAAQETGRVTLAAPHAFTVTGPLIALDLAPMSAALGRKVDAVLGGDVLGNFAVMLQPAKSMLSLAPSGSIAAPPGTIVVPVGAGNAIAAEVNGRPVRLKVDFGFNGVVRLTDAAWRNAFPNGAAGAAGSQTTADGITRATRSGRGDITVGGRAALRGAVVDSGYAPGEIDGLLGNGFLLRGTSVLDVKRQQLILVPRTAP